MPVTRRLPFIRTLLALTAALALVLVGALALWQLERISVAPGMLSGGSIPVCAPRDGIVAEVLARSGGQAHAGDPILKLDTRDLTVDAARRTALIEAMQTRRRSSVEQREHLLAEIHPKEREEAARAVERTGIKLTQAEIAAKAITRLGEEGIAGQLQVQQVELERKLAEMAVTEAREAATLVAERHRSQRAALDAEVRRLEEEIQAEQVQLQGVQTAIDASLVRAGQEGVVLTENLGDLAGRAVHAGDEILRLGVAVPRRFEGMLSDTARAQVRPHQKVKIRLDAYPWLLHGTVKGEVVGVSDRRVPGAGFPVEIEIEAAAAPGLLADGMRGTARIAIGRKISLLQMFLEAATDRSGV